jgi:cytochrome P450
MASRFLGDPRGPIEECTRRYGPVWQSLIPGRGGLVPLTWLMGRDGNERVLAPKYKDDFSWYEGYRFTMEPLFGRQILFLLDDEGEEAAHRCRQRLLLPAFHPNLDGEYLAVMGRIIDEHLGELSRDRTSGADIDVDMQALIKRLTFHIIAKLLLGAQERDLDELTELFEELGRGLYSVIHLPIPGLPFQRARRARASLHRYLHEQLQACRGGAQTPPPMLAALLAAQRQDGERLPDESIISELVAFLYAGYDTSSSLLTSLVVALGENPPVYERLAAALRVKEDEAGCAYLDAVILEAERLYPPLLFALRGVRRDFSYAGYDIKAGSKVTYSPYFTGRQPELFADPLAFAPERFLDANGAVRRPAPYTLVGFGGGHRMCIGKRLAGLQMRLLVKTLLRRFELHFSPQAEDGLYFNPALQRKHGYRVKLSRFPGPLG